MNHLQVQQSIESLRNRITSSLQNCFDAEDIKSLVKVLLTYLPIAKNCQGLPNLDIVGTKVIKNLSQGLVLLYGSVDEFIESENKIEQLSDPNKVRTRATFDILTKTLF